LVVVALPDILVELPEADIIELPDATADEDEAEDDPDAAPRPEAV
jgi:hypothetical protein